MIQKVALYVFISLLPFANGIIGGFTASPGQFPYMISIRNKYDDHLCGGTIINTKFVLTAEHCIRTRRPEDIRVVPGTNKLSVSFKYYLVERIHSSHDISILKLSEYIVFSNLIQPLPLYKSEPPVNVSMIVTGWGFKNVGNFEFPDKLQFEKVKTISLSQCISKFTNGNNISDKNICTFTKYGEGLCVGDSGGPLMYEGQLVGIVSYGIPCAVGYPDVFIKVSALYHWIKTEISIM